MSHGAAVKAYRETGLKAEIGITLNLNLAYPHKPDDPEDVAAAERTNMQYNNLFADPVLKGIYPQEFFDYLQGRGVILPTILAGDMDLINQELDFLGVNSYYSIYAKADPENWPLGVRQVTSGKARTDANWEVVPEGMYDLLKWVDTSYHPKKIIITENGAACNDWVNLEGKVEDPNRIDYLRRYLDAINRAINEGVQIKGYYVWCFCDNFEWAWGLSRRFGIVYVDYVTQKRIPKASAYWLSDVIKNNSF